MTGGGPESGACHDERIIDRIYDLRRYARDLWFATHPEDDFESYIDGGPFGCESHEFCADANEYDMVTVYCDGWGFLTAAIPGSFELYKKEERG